MHSLYSLYENNAFLFSSKSLFKCNNEMLTGGLRSPWGGSGEVIAERWDFAWAWACARAGRCCCGRAGSRVRRAPVPRELLSAAWRPLHVSQRSLFSAFEYLSHLIPSALLFCMRGSSGHTCVPLFPLILMKRVSEYICSFTALSDLFP